MSELQDWKRDGFRGEKMIVLPTESFQDYVEHPLVRRLYLTDVGIFPRAEYHFRERKDGIEEYIYIYCMEGSGTIEVEETSKEEQRNTGESAGISRNLKFRKNGFPQNDQIPRPLELTATRENSNQR